MWVLMTHKKSINTARKSLKEARIKNNSHAASKTFFLDFMLVGRCFKGAI